MTSYFLLLSYWFIHHCFAPSFTFLPKSSCLGWFPLPEIFLLYSFLSACHPLHSKPNSNCTSSNKSFHLLYPTAICLYFDDNYSDCICWTLNQDTCFDNDKYTYRNNVIDYLKSRWFQTIHSTCLPYCSIHYSLPCVGVNYVFVWILPDVVSKNFCHMHPCITPHLSDSFVFCRQSFFFF